MATAIATETLSTLGVNPDELWFALGKEAKVLCGAKKSIFTAEGVSWVLTAAPNRRGSNMAFVDRSIQASAVLRRYEQMFQSTPFNAGMICIREPLEGDSLRKELAKVSLRFRENVTQMVADPGYEVRVDAKPLGLDIVQVQDNRALEEAALVMVGGDLERAKRCLNSFKQGLLNDPRINIFLGRHDGIPVTSVVTVKADGKKIGIWDMRTLENYQRRGFGTALLNAALGLHRRQNIELFHLYSTEEGQRLYQKMGFTTADTGYVYDYQGPRMVIAHLPTDAPRLFF